MSTKWPQGDITAIQPATVLGGNNISGVYTLDQLNRLNADFGPQMQRSLRLRSSASACLTKTLSGTATKFTFSAWIKRGVLSTNQIIFDIWEGLSGSNGVSLGFNSSNQLVIGFDNYTGSSGFAGVLASTAVFRDPSAWYHIEFAADFSAGSWTAFPTVCVNAVAQSFSQSGATYGSWSAGSITYNKGFIAVLTATGTPYAGYYFDGYMAEVNFIDGQALDPSYFGKYNATTGVWQPSFYTGSYGTNGFRLTFANNTSTTTLGYDSSPNGNNWTTNNISLTSGSTYDSMLDVPTNWTSGDPIQARGNYAVLNPLMAIVGNAPSNANLREASTGADTYTGARATFGISSGKWYWEQTIDTLNTSNAGFAQIGGGVCIATYALSSGNGSAGSWGFQNGNGAGTFSWKFDNGTGTNTYTLFGQGDIAGFALDMGAGTLDVYRNNTLLFTCSSSLSGNTVFPYVLVYQVSSSYTAISSVNFGQRPFAYTPPTGFKALNTQNLSMPTIYNGANYMAATLYTGNGSTQNVINAVNGVSFQPDFVWCKGRSLAYDNGLYDSVRGTNQMLVSNTTGQEFTIASSVTAFNANGFSLGSNITFNQTSGTFVAWQWKAGGTAVTNTAGSITSQVSANTTAGFSVVTYTGNGAASTQTIGHGLSSSLSMVIIKARITGGNDNNWGVSHTSISAPSYMYLNTTDAASNLGPAQGQPSIGTGNTFKVLVGTTGTNNFNASGITYVAYCFAAIPGYSAFGSYTGNGSSDGPFVFTNFRPRWIMVKRTDASGENWYIEDTARDTYNPQTTYLDANQSLADQTGVLVDYLSNGFKLRYSGTGENASGGTYIYAAFAENPFKYSLAR